MKKFFILFLLLFILIPFNVKAEELNPKIEYAWITGANVKTEGETLSLSFGVKLSGIEKANSNSLGILAISYELDFDDTIFTVTNISSQYWDSTLYEEDGKYYVLSMVTDFNGDKNKCADLVTYCADYLVTIEFFVNETSKTNTEIKMNELEVMLSKMINPNIGIVEDDITILTDNPNEIYAIEIKDKEPDEKIEKPDDIVNETKPEIKPTIKTNTGKKNDKNTVKSDNNYLKSLEIKNYDINFDKNTKEYEITIEDEVNQLDLDVKTDDDKSSYKIIGADDLSKNNYKIIIEVTAENGDKNTYTITVKYKGNTANIVDEGNNEEKSDKAKINQKFVIIGGITIGLIILITITVKIILYVKDRKIDKALDKL